MKQILVGSSLFLTFCILSGCNGDKLNRQAVSGTVIYKNKNVVIGSVTFMPIPETGPTNISATVRDGKFEVPQKDGLSPGKYLVRFSAFDREVNAPPPGTPGPTPEPAKELMPPKHSTYSKHEVEVKSGTPNVFDFKLD